MKLKPKAKTYDWNIANSKIATVVKIVVYDVKFYFPAFKEFGVL